MFKLVIVQALAILTLSDSSSADCWDTGCQPNSWAVTGCAQYQRGEAGRRPCPGGTIYTCCSGGGDGRPYPPSGSTKNGDVTYYNLGMTVCGQAYSDYDMVAAIAFSYFTTPNPNNDPMCGRRARVTDPGTGRSVEVTIRDKCQACRPGDIDLSPAAFQRLRDLGTGRFPAQWDFI